MAFAWGAPLPGLPLPPLSTQIPSRPLAQFQQPPPVALGPFAFHTQSPEGLPQTMQSGIPQPYTSSGAGNLRTCETFHSGIPAPEVNADMERSRQTNLLQHGVRHAETFITDSSSGVAQATCAHGARDQMGTLQTRPQQHSAHASLDRKDVPQTRLPPHLVAAPQPSESHGSRESSYARAPRLDGIAIKDAAAVFIPKPPPSLGISNERQGDDPVSVKIRAKELHLQLKLQVSHLERKVKRLYTGEGKLLRKIQTKGKKGHVEEIQNLACTIIQSRKSISLAESTKNVIQGALQDLASSIATLRTSSPPQLCADVLHKLEEITMIPEVQTTFREMQCFDVPGYEAEDGNVNVMIAGAAQASTEEIQNLLHEVSLVHQVGLLTNPRLAEIPTPQL